MIILKLTLLVFSPRFMPPDDPLGRHGPSLDNFLSKEPRQPEPLPPICPYGSKKCTYGNKCKFYHPERGNMPHKMVTEKLAEQAKQKIQEVRENRKTQEGKEFLFLKVFTQKADDVLRDGLPKTLFLHVSHLCNLKLIQPAEETVELVNIQLYSMVCFFLPLMKLRLSFYLTEHFLEK